MSSVGLILVAASDRQHIFWDSYLRHRAGLSHDMIVVHRGYQHQFQHPECDRVIYENKIINSQEVPHRAFGAYRYFGLKYINNYDYLAFISDDVSIRADNWLARSIETFIHPKIGCVATQLFNGLHNQYPHPSHARSPIWFAATQALAEVKWVFDSDHDGEMRIADQFLEAGFITVQAGNKINIAYDAFEPDHITVLMESFLSNKYNEEDLLSRLRVGDISDMNIVSPYGHIGTRNIIRDIQPYHGLIYDRAVELAKTYNLAKEYPFRTFLL